MKTFTLLFLVFFSFQLSAQNTAEDSLLMNIRSIKFSILEPFEPSSNSYLLSYEHQIGRHITLLAEAGPTIGAAYSGPDRVKTYGHKMRFELRGYGKIKYGRRLYIGLQYMHKKLSGKDFEDTFFSEHDPKPRYNHYYELEFDYLKKVTALHVTAGAVIVCWRRVMIDFCFFGGFRHKKLTAEGLPDHFFLKGWDYDYWIQPVERIPFDNTTINAGFLCRVGIAFNKISGAAFIGPYERF